MTRRKGAHWNPLQVLPGSLDCGRTALSIRALEQMLGTVQQAGHFFSLCVRNNVGFGGYLTWLMLPGLWLEKLAPILKMGRLFFFLSLSLSLGILMDLSYFRPCE